MSLKGLVNEPGPSGSPSAGTWKQLLVMLVSVGALMRVDLRMRDFRMDLRMGVNLRMRDFRMGPSYISMKRLRVSVGSGGAVCLWSRGVRGRGVGRGRGKGVARPISSGGSRRSRG